MILRGMVLCRAGLLAVRKGFLHEIYGLQSAESKSCKSRGLYSRRLSTTPITMILDSPSPEDIAAETREAWRRRPKKSSHELFQELVRKGWINARGQVTKFLGGEAEPEPNYETWTDNATTGERE